MVQQHLTPHRQVLFVSGGVTTSAQAAAQHLATQHRQGAAASSSTGSRQQARLLGDNEQGLPMLRGAACCPFFLGTGACAFRAACKYHHPMHAMHPECVQHGEHLGCAAAVADQ